jgi:hypothetical protein
VDELARVDLLGVGGLAEVVAVGRVELVAEHPSLVSGPDGLTSLRPEAPGLERPVPLSQALRHRASDIPGGTLGSPASI